MAYTVQRPKLTLAERLYFPSIIKGMKITLGHLIQMNAYLALLVWPTLALGWMIAVIKRGQAAWERAATADANEPSVRPRDPPAGG